MGHISALFIYVVLVQGSKVMLYYECMTLYSKLGYANSNTLNQGVRNRKITRFKDALKCKGSKKLIL